jgi:hypothetical protein
MFFEENPASQSTAFKPEELYHFHSGDDTRLEKQGIAWLLNVHTTVTVRWVANRLEFGVAENASRAINQFRKEEKKGMKSLKKKLKELLK